MGFKIGLHRGVHLWGPVIDNRESEMCLPNLSPNNDGFTSFLVSVLGVQPAYVPCLLALFWIWPVLKLILLS